MVPPLFAVRPRSGRRLIYMSDIFGNIQNVIVAGALSRNGKLDLARHLDHLLSADQLYCNQKVLKVIDLIQMMFRKE